MKTPFISIKGRKFRRIVKPVARALFGIDKVIYLCPNNLLPFTDWHCETPISRATADGRSFDQIVNEFEARNCINAETGKYASYYVEEVV